MREICLVRLDKIRPALVLTRETARGAMTKVAVAPITTTIKGLSSEVRLRSCELLNQVLADTQILYALYKKHHWLVRGVTFYQLHLLLDKHAGEQLELVDSLAERVQTLGGIAVGDPGTSPR